MKRLIIAVVLLCGCNSEPRNVIYNFEEGLMFRIPPRASIEWDDIALSELGELGKDRKSTRDIKIIDGEITGDRRYTETWCWVVDEEIMEKVYKIKVKEDLRKNIFERLWNWLGF